MAYRTGDADARGIKTPACPAPPRGSVFRGPTYFGQGGVRILLGKAREEENNSMVGR